MSLFEHWINVIWIFSIGWFSTENGKKTIILLDLMSLIVFSTKVVFVSTQFIIVIRFNWFSRMFLLGFLPVFLVWIEIEFIMTMSHFPMETRRFVKSVNGNRHVGNHWTDIGTTAPVSACSSLCVMKFSLSCGPRSEAVRRNAVPHAVPVRIRVGRWGMSAVPVPRPVPGHQMPRLADLPPGRRSLRQRALPSRPHLCVSRFFHVLINKKDLHWRLKSRVWTVVDCWFIFCRLS